MMNDVFGLIYAGETNHNLRDLVMSRSVAALPLGGRYRAIDFYLSNMVNSGIRNVGVITQQNYKSLMDHLGPGKEWNLSRKNNGLFILPPFDTDSSRTGHYRGICEAINSQMDYVNNAPQQYCLLCGSYTIYNSTYNEMMEIHMANKADITMLYNVEARDTLSDGERFKDVRLSVEADGRVMDIEYDSPTSNSDKLAMDIYLMDKSLLEYLVNGACSRSRYEFVPDALLPNLSQLRVYAMEYKGYVGRLHSLRSYYDINMDMLKRDTRRNLFYTGNTIYTKIKDEPSAKYLDHAAVKNCIVGDGCEIDGQIEDCVLFRGVRVGRNTKLKGCIIMQDSEISDDCQLTNVIIDKSVIVRKGRSLIGMREYPMVIRKKAVL